MRSSFTLSCPDNINLKKYKVFFKDYKIEIRKILNILFSMPEIKKNKIFNEEINKISFDVAFCSDDTIHQINREYRKKDSSTDVITFSLFFDSDDSVIVNKTAELGQIIISVETAYRQKDENKNDLRKEILTLLIHGILHLFGFDHLTKKDYDFVVDIQNRVLSKL